MTIRKDRWNTYATRGYTYDAANDQSSAGGVHLHQVRRAANGWVQRILQSNGCHRAAGPVNVVGTDVGESLFELAKTA